MSRKDDNPDPSQLIDCIADVMRDALTRHPCEHPIDVMCALASAVEGVDAFITALDNRGLNITRRPTP